MKHELIREHGGTGMMGWMRPTCTCGWRGVERYAYDDYQLSEVARQESSHLREANTPAAQAEATPTTTR